MTARIIDGKARAERLTGEVAGKVAERVAAGKPRPGLAVVLVGENPASQVYVRNKRRTTDAAGMLSFSHDLPVTTSQDALLTLIEYLALPHWSLLRLVLLATLICTPLIPWIWQYSRVIWIHFDQYFDPSA